MIIAITMIVKIVIMVMVTIQRGRLRDEPACHFGLLVVQFFTRVAGAKVHLPSPKLTWKLIESPYRGQ